MHILTKILLTLSVLAALLMLYVGNYALAGVHFVIAAAMLANFAAEATKARKEKGQ
jgi:membrane protein implicated in regulation of membrane protease activity